jgi:hypothetical protein
MTCSNLPSTGTVVLTCGGNLPHLHNNNIIAMVRNCESLKLSILDGSKSERIKYYYIVVVVGR